MVTLWVSARIAGTGQTTILVEQPSSNSRLPSGTRRNRRMLIDAILSLQCPLTMPPYDAQERWQCPRAVALDFCPWSARLLESPPIWAADHNKAVGRWKALNTRNANGFAVSRAEPEPSWRSIPRSVSKNWNGY